MLGSSKALAIALLVAVFVAGGAAGWVARDEYGRGGRRGRHHGGDRMVLLLTKKLDLSSAQEDSVRAIFDRRRGELEAIWKDVHPRYDSLRAMARTEIETHLTPEQRARYASIVGDLDRRRRDRRAGSSGEKP